MGPAAVTKVSAGGIFLLRLRVRFRYAQAGYIRRREGRMSGSALTLLQALIIYSDEKSWLWDVVGLAFGAYWFYRGFFLLARRRLILDTPASKIRSASIGLV